MKILELLVHGAIVLVASACIAISLFTFAIGIMGIQ